MKEYTKDLLVAQVFSLCFKHPKTIDELAKQIYSKGHAKSIIRIYQCCEVMMQQGILLPKFQNGQLRFQVNREAFKK